MAAAAAAAALPLPLDAVPDVERNERDTIELSSAPSGPLCRPLPMPSSSDKTPESGPRSLLPPPAPPALAPAPGDDDRAVELVDAVETARDRLDALPWREDMTPTNDKELGRCWPPLGSVVSAEC